MPSSNIHLKVAYELNRRLSINSTDFIVGNIAPDAVNLNGFASREERWTAHIRDKDLDIWLSKVRDFYNENYSLFPYEFFLGYISHIITDIIHDQYLYMKQRKQIEREPCNQGKDGHDVLRKDMDNYSFPEFSEIKAVLEKYHNSNSILNISSTLLDNWIKKVLENYKGNSISKYQKDEDIELLISLVGKELKQLTMEREIKYK